MKKLMKFIKAWKRAKKCEDMLTFAKYRDGMCTEMCTYPKDMLWTNADLLKNQRYGLVLCERSGNVEEGLFSMVDGKLVQGEK